VHLLIVLSLSLFALGLVESFRHRRNLLRIPVRVLVNGTRGKSSVTRLVAAALREAGYRTIAKTTGSDARIILEDGSEIPVARPFGARITEQKAFARLALKHKAGAIVVECMAVRPESQMMMQRHLVRATIGVITNVRVDHIEEIGSTLEDTAFALSFSIPEDGILVTADPRFLGKAARVVVADPSAISDEILEGWHYPEFPENISLALQVAAELGIDKETALHGMSRSEPDIGALRIFRIETSSCKAIFINGFAANDPASTGMVWAEASARLPENLPMVLLYNNRRDREYRIREFAKLLPAALEPALVAVSGDHGRKVARMFSKPGRETLIIDPRASNEDLLARIAAKMGGPFLLFGIGNISGAGRSLVAYCLEHGSACSRRGEVQCLGNP